MTPRSVDLETTGYVNFDGTRMTRSANDQCYYSEEAGARRTLSGRINAPRLKESSLVRLLQGIARPVASRMARFGARFGVLYD